MLIDVHTHLWKGIEAQCRPGILDMCDSFGIDKVLVSSLGGYQPDPEEIRYLNDQTYGFMKEHPGLVEGYCYLNPRHPDALTELHRRVEDQGMCGVKLWVATFCDDPLVDPIAEQCVSYGIPMLVHAFYKAVDQLPCESLGENVANLARRHPDAKILMAHLGADCLREMRMVKDCKNVWLDFSGSISHADDLEYAVRLVGADRLLFGSDMPDLAFQCSYGQLIEADLTPEDREKIAWKNAVRLFGFDGEAVK